MRKARPADGYPVESGHYLVGNHFSPVAAVVLLNSDYGKIPPAVENLVRAAIETGAALAGTLQTANIGLEKMVANVVANPNIRYLVLCGVETAGHFPGDALRALLENGIDRRRVIQGTRAPTAYLFNLPLEAIERFRQQVVLVNLLGETNSDRVGKAVWACHQERPTEFDGYSLFDPGAFSEAPLAVKITWRVTKPEEVEEWEIEDVLKDLEER